LAEWPAVHPTGAGSGTAGVFLCAPRAVNVKKKNPISMKNGVFLGIFG